MNDFAVGAFSVVFVVIFLPALLTWDLYNSGLFFMLKNKPLFLVFIVLMTFCGIFNSRHKKT
jgi:hypothetical protein